MLEQVIRHGQDHRKMFDEIITNAYLLNQIAQSAEMIIESYKKQGKLLAAGNGGSATQADHLAEELAAYYQKRRPGLPAVSLCQGSTITCIANDTEFKYIFSRQIEALASPGDIFYGLSTSGNSKNIIYALSAAHKKEMRSILLTGESGGDLANLVNGNDILIKVPHTSSDRIQEAHLTIIHIHCSLIENTLFPGK